MFYRIHPLVKYLMIRQRRNAKRWGHNTHFQIKKYIYFDNKLETGLLMYSFICIRELLPTSLDKKNAF